MQIIIFCLTLWLIFYIPAKLILRLTFRDDFNPGVTLGIGVGLWTFVSYLTHMARIDQYLPIYILACLVVFIKSFKFKPKLLTTRIDWILIIIVGIGVILQSIFIITSGVNSDKGMQFSYINSYDGITYTANSQALTHNFPPYEPGMSNKIMKNYHYLSFMVAADISKLSGIEVARLHFSLIPLAVTTVLGFVAFNLGLVFTGSKRGGYLFALFMYAASDFGYLVSGVLLHKFSVTGLQSVDSNFLLLTNFPRSIAVIVMLSAWTLLWKYKNNLSTFKVAILGIVGASLIGLKIYYGMYFLLLLGLFGYKKWFGMLLSAVSAAVVFLPANSGAGGLVFVPGAWPRHFFASTMLQETQWPLKEQVYVNTGNKIHLFVLYCQYIGVYLFTSLGIRIMGIANFRHFRVWGLSILFVLVSVGFLQKTGVYDIFNFLSVGAVGLSLLLSDWLARRKWWIVVLVLTAMLPRPLWQAYQAMYNSAYQYISTNEMQALTYLKNNSSKNAVIYVWPGNALSYSPYVQLFADRQVYLSNQGILRSHNVDISARQSEVDAIEQSQEFKDVVDKLKKIGVDFVYTKKSSLSWDKYKINPSDYWYSNDEVAIYKIK
jgi:hypothetical protein